MKRILWAALALSLVSGCGSSPVVSPSLVNSPSLFSSRATEAAPAVFDFQGFSPAAGAKLSASATYKGISANGSAEVKRFDPSNLDLMIHVRKLLISADVHIVLEAQRDGTVRFLAQQVSGNSPSNDPNEGAGTLKVKSVETNRSVFVFDDGQLVTVAVQKNVLTLSYGENSVTLR